MHWNTNSFIPRKTVYGKCPKCRTKSQLEVLSSNPGNEKFRCNMCYNKFTMDELWDGIQPIESILYCNINEFVKLIEVTIVLKIQEINIEICVGPN